MEKKKTTKEPPSEKAQVAETPHAELSVRTAQTEPETPAIQTPVVRPSQAGTSQTPAQIPSIPLDAVRILLQALSPDLNMEETLARMAAGNQNPAIVQTSSVPTPQPPPEPTKPSHDQAKTSTHQETKPDEPKASAPDTSQSTSHTSGENETYLTKTTPTQIPGTEGPTNQTTETLAETEAVGREGKSEELVEAEEVRGKRMNESEIVVEAEEIREAREMGMKTKEGEEVSYVERIVGEVSESGGSDSEREENSGGTSRVSSEENREGVESHESDEEAEVVSEENPRPQR